MTSNGAPMELTMGTVPISRALLSETALSLALALKPFVCHRKANSNKLAHADDIGRCRTCNAYQNVYSPFDERGYVCTFCYSENTFDQRRNGRYLGRQNRSTLPELQGEVYDVSLDEEVEVYVESSRGEGDDQGEPGQGVEHVRNEDLARSGVPVNSMYFAVVDVCGRADDVEEFRSTLLTVLDVLSEDQYFGLALLDESAMYVMNWKANRFHTIRCTDEAALGTMSDRVALRDVLGRVQTVKKGAEVLISQLEPKPVKAGEEHLHSCFLGEAIKGLLGFLVKARRDFVDDIDIDGRMIGSRIATFLSKVPAKGVGRVLSLESRMAEQQTGYYQDPLNPEFAMANLNLNPDDHERGKDREQAPVPEVDVDHQAAVGQGARACETSFGSYTNTGILDGVAQDFYSGAGAAAAVTGLAMDVYVVGQGKDVIGVESLAVMTSLSGGDFTVYDEDNVTLAEDVYDMMQRDEVLDCSIKIRTSAELQILGNMDSRIHEDSDQKNLYHAPRISCDATCGGIILEVNDAGLGLSNRPPVYLQAAVRYHRIEDGFLHTYLRVITCEFPVASTIGSVLSNHNVNFSLFIEFIGAMSVVGLHGRDEAAAVLDKRLEEYVAKRRSYMEHGDYVGDQGNSLGPDVFGFGMHRMIAILDGGGRPGEFESLERLFYGRRASTEELVKILKGNEDAK